MIRLMSADNTRVNYLTEKQAELRKNKKMAITNETIKNDLGMPVLGL